MSAKLIKAGFYRVTFHGVRFYVKAAHGCEAICAVLTKQKVFL